MCASCKEQLLLQLLDDEHSMTRLTWVLKMLALPLASSLFASLRSAPVSSFKIQSSKYACDIIGLSLFKMLHTCTSSYSIILLQVILFFFHWPQLLNHADASSSSATNQLAHWEDVVIVRSSIKHRMLPRSTTLISSFCCC